MQKHRSKGVTLIELMVVVVIVAILASIAYPSYRRYAIRANRTEGKVALMQLTQALERCYTRLHDYQECSNGDPNDVTVVLATPAGHYTTGFVAAPTPTAYRLQAVPQAGQVEDTTCGTLSIDQSGDRLETGTGTVQDCW